MTAVDSAALEAEALRFTYGQPFTLEVSRLTLERSGMTALLGPNGSGKTTLLKLLSGVHSPQNGDVRLQGGDLKRMRRKDVAQQLAVVPQNPSVPFAFTVYEIAMLGRTAYARLFQDETSDDRAAVQRALHVTCLSGMAAHPYAELSGGEQQRVLLAMALAQEPRVLLLDEPTAHLDVGYQVQMLDLLRGLNASEGITILAAMHDLNLAALYFPRLLLMRGGRIVADGPADAVLTEDIIRDVYGTDVVVQRHPTRGVPQVLPQPLA